MDLWQLVHTKQHLDPSEVVQAMELQLQEPLDYRTRLLIHECAQALRHFWGAPRWEKWVTRHPEVAALERQTFEEVGFPSIEVRLMEPVRQDVIEDYFRELGSEVRHSVQLVIGGSVALILPGLLQRHTDDINVTDEVPSELGEMRTRLENLGGRYGLRLAHFQTHYLPSGLDDLRALRPHIAKSEVVDRLGNAARLLEEGKLRENAVKNWYILYGERLPA